MERGAQAGHLSDEELFTLALPPAGEPEALPAHLLRCVRCGRALQEWKAAVRHLAEEDAEPVARRSSGEWQAAENRTIEALRRAGKRRRLRPLPWAIGLAAAALLAALLLPILRPSRPAAPASVAASAATPAPELTGQDAADDRLLRDVARLSRGEDGADWSGLAPDPASVEGGAL
ncbi:MAG: hypothetical protein ACM3SU_03180 [Acidobacteriota bacterium]